MTMSNALEITLRLIKFQSEDFASLFGLDRVKCFEKVINMNVVKVAFLLKSHTVVKFMMDGKIL